jgi:FtsH-binding integral membrane protein
MDFNQQDNGHFFLDQTETSSEIQTQFFAKVFTWMFVALAITGLTAYTVSTNSAWMETIYYTNLKWLVMLAPLGLVFLIGGKLDRFNAMTVTILFFVFAVLMGVSMSYIFMIYTAASITSTFFICSATFGAMAAIGYFTKRDLTKMGSFLYMALIGLIITSIVNWFIGSSMIYWISSVIGILIFTGLTIYDTKRLKELALVYANDEEMMQKGAIHGALSLYLNFINLFIYLLRFFGDRD